MADVRSLLRSELASRKGTSQPNTTGNRVTKKRKVDSGDGVMRKKLRAAEQDTFQSASGAASIEHTTEDEGSEQVEDDVAGPEPPLDNEQEVVESAADLAEEPTTRPREDPSTPIDEEAWAAFEREVAAQSDEPHVPAALTAEATISAAPVTAAELAAQQERSKTSTARTREAEMEGEREDAARLLEEEFDEMDQLEERVRRLKHKREELRKSRAEDKTQDEPIGSGAVEQVESESEDDDDEDWDDWRFK
ncbi:hypothetical protein DTO013E5_6708 [Penicillium roqueforti]|uniref:Genomic scaffold, ProqFM164S04 n=1 Tax=Penicillium roqueforti (strain FM164) TaxID=1365484 RepID=W6R0F8_PENRF|nr:uncharacterized protein LCP9604111_6628 [Penicillium roqueforti]CDM35277.1 unnamed protein product [Penicillium roqueforti FM164]KAF9245956.1 hypothetical protein LCP9604111_6628 [Penicillium roqueforti]KAI1834568.1 hypothetical protein CBS147337_4858 [Penicillium roqueforti]KAI2685906.1 hypothetical protein CBS147355_1393 [Penicillium roqueforti]KAI2692109.1 hypothetical protein LCP963914a_203 [Penicillium roqueforti]